MSAINTQEKATVGARPFANLNSAYFAYPIRFCLAWIFFSAAWRRVVLAPGKLEIGPKWVGHKINHFYPNALLVKDALEYMITNPNFMWGMLIVFTLTEAAVGIGMALGLLTRISALVTAVLSFAMLLSAGWLGATCLDEWQIGVLCTMAAMVLCFIGPGEFSLDHLIGKKFPWWTSGWRSWLTDGPVLNEKAGKGLVYFGTAFVVISMLATNQAFVGGVWGKLFNPSAKPHVVVSDVAVSGNDITMTVFRDQGPDTYGANVTEATVVDASGKPIASLYGKELAKAMKKAKESGQIKNFYVNNVTPGPDGISIPLGGKAKITLDFGKQLTGAKEVILRDVSIKPDQKAKLWIGTVQ